MKLAIFLSILNLAVAAPFLPKRDIVYHIVTEVVVKTVDLTTTVWVPAQAHDAQPVEHDQPTIYDKPITTSTSTSASHTTSSTPMPQPLIQVEAPHSSTPLSIPTPQPQPKVDVQLPPPPPPSPPPPPPSATPSTVPIKPASNLDSGTSNPPPSPAYAGTMLPGATVSDDCPPDSPCVGDVTFYNSSVGVGACGSGPDAGPGGVYGDNDTPVIAVAVAMMGSLSSGSTMNALCFRHARIVNPNNNKEVTAMVVDKCFGCPGQKDLDLNPAAFNQIVDSMSTGRVHGIQWNWL